MAYRELINVANGVRGQLDACISALDEHQDPPAEVEDLTMALENALQICESIVRQGEAEPEPTEEALPLSEQGIAQ